jgi:hypothetical protein
MEADLSYPQPAEVVPLREGIPSDVTQTEPSGAGEKAIASPEEVFSGWSCAASDSGETQWRPGAPRR